MIKVLIADDHRVVRAGLEALLNSVEDMTVVASASNGHEAVSLALQCEPDIVVMDLSMPDLDGIEATRQITAANPSIKIMVLTSFSDRTRVLAAIDAGAVGYVLKDSDADDLLRSLRTTANDLAPIDPRAARALLGSARGPEPDVVHLTDRERGVLELVVAGLANKQIAHRLGIAEATVKAHLTNVFGRIGVTDRTQAALWAERHGIGRG